MKDALGNQKINATLLLMPSENDHIAGEILRENLGRIGIHVDFNIQTTDMFNEVARQAIMADPTWIVALQAVGGASGNIICVHNVVAASAVVGLIGKEGAVIRKTLMPFFYYALLTGSLGYGIVNMSSGVFNAGFILAALIFATMIYFIFRFNRSDAT